MANPNNLATIEFISGVNETDVPEIRLTRSRDGRTGQAFFVFEQPDALASGSMGEITGMRLIDEEGELTTREVKARFINGSPSVLEATYIWKSEVDFERFMRFARRYADSHGLGYSESSDQNS